MQIHSITKVLVLPIVIAALAIIYFSYNTYNAYSIYIFIPVVLLVVLFTFQGPLDHWYLSKFPIPFDSKLKEWLTRYFPFYNSLDDATRDKFEYRLTLYLEGRLFQSVGAEVRDVPEDIKCMVAAHAVRLGLVHEDYLIGDMDRIFLYKHPFPTPRQHTLHSVEIDIEDGVIILSLEQLVNAVLDPQQYYNVAYHAYVSSFIALHPDKDYPKFENWGNLEHFSSMTKETILSQTGLVEVDLLTAHVVAYFVYGEAYETNFPEEFERLFKIFG